MWTYQFPVSTARQQRANNTPLLELPYNTKSDDRAFNFLFLKVDKVSPGVE
jgi:hypothetical protein